MIDSRWTTERSIVSDSVGEEVPELQRVLESIRETLRLEGKEEISSDEMSRWFLDGNLPPNGRKDRYRLQTISRKDDGEVIGYLSVYHGYPDAATLYIDSLSVRRECQGRGYGAEVVARMPALDGLREYPTHRLVVAVRNWGAVRFWVRHGFTRIASLGGDLLSAEGSGARLELLRSV